MKMLFVVYSREMDEEIVAAFKRSGIQGYTKMKEICGEGRDTEPKQGSHIWPGMNNALFLAVPDDDAAKGLELVRQWKKDRPRDGLKAFVLPLEEWV